MEMKQGLFSWNNNLLTHLIVGKWKITVSSYSRDEIKLINNHTTFRNYFLRTIIRLSKTKKTARKDIVSKYRTNILLICPLSVKFGLNLKSDKNGFDRLGVSFLNKIRRFCEFESKSIYLRLVNTSVYCYHLRFIG